jgi:hypothetical protein
MKFGPHLQSGDAGFQKLRSYRIPRKYVLLTTCVPLQKLPLFKVNNKTAIMYSYQYLSLSLLASAVLSAPDFSAKEVSPFMYLITL